MQTVPFAGKFTAYEPRKETKRQAERAARAKERRGKFALTVKKEADKIAAREIAERRLRMNADDLRKNVVAGLPIFAKAETVRRVTEALMEHGRTWAEMRSPSRIGYIVAARHEIMWILYDCGLSLLSIGRLLDRDHTSVLHGVRVYDAMLRGEVYRRPDKRKAKVEAEARP